MITALHHIQLAMPSGREDEARAFYEHGLGLTEVPKPPALQGRGGVWFEADGVRVHLGVEDLFSPARKAHPAFQVADLAATMALLDARAIPYTRDVDLPDFKRVFVHDPFGNRIELLELTTPD